MWYVVMGIIVGTITVVCATVRLLAWDHKIQWGHKEIEINLRSPLGILWALVNLAAGFIIEGALWPIELPVKLFEIQRIVRCRKKYGDLWWLMYKMGF